MGVSPKASSSVPRGWCTVVGSESFVEDYIGLPISMYVAAPSLVMIAQGPMRRRPISNPMIDDSHRQQVLTVR